MTTPRVIPDDQLERIKELVALGFTDEAIGRKYGSDKQNAFHFRKRHGIAKPKVSSSPKPACEVLPGPGSPIRSYFDAVLKHIVNVFAPGYAPGSLPEDRSELPYEEEVDLVDTSIPHESEPSRKNRHDH